MIPLPALLVLLAVAAASPAGDDLSEADAARAAGNLWDAEAAYGRALAERPDSYEAALGRGEVTLDIAAATAAAPSPRGAEVRALASDARRWLAAASALRPGEIRPRRGLARARLLDLDFAGAAADLRALASGDAARDPEIHHLLAGALRASGDAAGAAAAEEACLALDPSRADAAAPRVGDLAAAGKSAEARAAGLAFLLRDPDAEPVYGALWNLASAGKRFDALEETLLAVIAKHPGNARPVHFLAYARFAAGHLDAALEAFRRKAALEPGAPDPLVQIGRILVGKSDLPGAERAFEQALALLDPADERRTAVLEGLHSIGSTHGQSRRFADAERVFRRLVALDPSNGSDRMFLGLSLRRLGRYEEAESCYRAAIDLAPFDGTPTNELGLLYLGWRRPEEARAVFLRAVEQDASLTSPLENLGHMERAAGRPAEAAKFYREAHRRAVAFRFEAERPKFRRYLDICARELEAADPDPGAPPR